MGNRVVQYHATTLYGEPCILTYRAQSVHAKGKIRNLEAATFKSHNCYGLRLSSLIEHVSQRGQSVNRAWLLVLNWQFRFFWYF